MRTRAKSTGQSMRLPFVLAASSVLASAAIWAVLIRPLDTLPLQGSNDPDYLGGSILLIPLAAGLVALGYRSRRWWALALSALAVPLVLGGISYAVRDELAWQREAREVFDRYTYRFPDRELSSPEIMSQTGSYLTLCADQRSRRPTGFCLEILVTRPNGEEVQGGFRYHEDELHPDVGFISVSPFDCFGSTVRCER